VQEGGGKVLVDERTLWPEGKYVTTHLIVRTAFLKDHPDTVQRLLEGHVAAVDYVNANPDEAQGVVNAGLAKLTGQAMAPTVVSAAWKNMRFTVDPLSSTLKKEAADAKAAGLLDSSVKLDGIHDLDLLNKLLTAAGKEPVKD
jgi:NitT/TauT family transport system substrate-binding protein